MTYRVQKNITINEAQKEFIKANHDKMNIGELSKMLGLGYNKVHNNMALMGMVKPYKTKVVTMKGYFDIDEFSKLYQF